MFGLALATFLLAQELPPPPQIFAPGDLTLTNDRERCYASGVLLGTPRAVDSAGGHTVAGVRDDDHSLSDPFPVGITTVTWTVTDAAGQTDWISQKVTVNDTEPPSIEAPRDIEVGEDDEDGLGTRVDEGDPIITDNCPASALRIQGKRSDGRDFEWRDEHPRYPAGSTIVVWTVSDRYGHQATASQQIVVKDRLPRIEAPPDVVAKADPGKCSAFVETGTPSLASRCARCTIVPIRSDGKRRTDIAFPVGETTIAWTVSTPFGEMRTAKQNVVVDSGGPAITNLTVTPKEIDPPNGRMVGVKVRYDAADGCGGPVTTSLSVASDGGEWDVLNSHAVDLRAIANRVYTITVKAVDAAGNESTTSSTVRVRPND